MCVESAKIGGFLNTLNIYSTSTNYELVRMYEFQESFLAKDRRQHKN